MHIKQEMKRALFIFAKLNPGLTYVQGMNELYAPLYYLFKRDTTAGVSTHAEADAFFCFVDLISEFRDNFCQQLVRTVDNWCLGHRTASVAGQQHRGHPRNAQRLCPGPCSGGPSSGCPPGQQRGQATVLRVSMDHAAAHTGMHHL